MTFTLDYFSSEIQNCSLNNKTNSSEKIYILLTYILLLLTIILLVNLSALQTTHALYNVCRKKFMSCFNRAVQTFVDSIWSTRKEKNITNEWINHSCCHLRHSDVELQAVVYILTYVVVAIDTVWVQRCDVPSSSNF